MAADGDALLSSAAEVLACWDFGRENLPLGRVV
jgi:hypothetical protein